MIAKPTLAKPDQTGHRPGSPRTRRGVLEGASGGVGPTIRSLAIDGLHVDDREEAGGQRDRLARQAVRVPGAVPTVVVRERNLDGRPEVRDPFEVCSALRGVRLS